MRECPRAPFLYVALLIPDSPQFDTYEPPGDNMNAIFLVLGHGFITTGHHCAAFPVPDNVSLVADKWGRGRQDGRSAALNECSRSRLIILPDPVALDPRGPGVRGSGGVYGEGGRGDNQRCQTLKSGSRGARKKSV
ncbi:hypothetical protein NDU88_010351 [Pleurodeles waltl]|uniref:Uncharacterized protein n=1 Tax=Pleurodeles waltl TaxID=8319 RepID=A0AAV7S154_PLEWA|nr:hypothetical protein NDU88_010351 [Pleurodeles waltl]